MRAARIGVKVAFTLRNDPAAPRPATLVNIVSDAELGGVLADFARTGGMAVANVIMADFARRAAEEFAQDDVEVPAAEGVAAKATPAEKPTVDSPGSAPAPLAAHSLLWAVMKAQFVRIGQWLGIVKSTPG